MSDKYEEKWIDRQIEREGEKYKDEDIEKSSEKI